MSLYELAILGSPAAEEREALTATLRGMLEDFGLVLGTDVVVYDGATVSGRDKRAAFAAAFFGAAAHTDIEAAHELVLASAPIIPTIAANGDFALHVPEFLQSANGLRRRADDPAMTELAAAILECVGLLRRQRRVFVSYRRVESRAAALQLHDLLNARGFDVFLDTHDIRPGDPFQDVLWHRLVDSDVMVMLDTPGYFDSRWTRQEIGRARAKDIQVLRVIWPEHVPSKLTDMAETVYLDPAELTASDGPIADQTVESIVLRVERLRSRSIAARFMSITGKLRADVEKIGASIEGVGAHRAIAVRLIGDRKVWAYPIVGVPTAEILNDVAEKARRAEQGEVPVLVYDHVGIRDAWSAHLRWLDEQILSVRAIKVSEAGWALAAWEG
ncbi:toll/interleukin-1 receptor domain-containing protein [Kaistia algarum]|uniref:toll/interleukin-1 receptor domain-containing protein n=1 Tax=Kaistia algarum TaxID=2083279 RepID=UPI000CE774DB|nr:toll/interleukin-1 receptor domain-containing protein [Kaistia algarum]MCX5512845.1 toll/interleukin-1 receptor domain-containing protein [Kaistia algarum]PPE81662.1 toll/interleukin-1 receptor domain-containing protein [Kaistia algarum]